MATETLTLPLRSSAAAPASSVPSIALDPSSSSDTLLADSRSEAPVHVEPSIPTEPSTAADKYFDVGSFKDSQWADNAVEILEKLGFHTTSLHKGRLWMNSYHVIVGPFHDDGTADAARQNLESHGFKPHLTKIE